MRELSEGRPNLPSMADTDYMVNVTQRELQKFVGQDTGSICKSKKRMIGENSTETHSPRMENCFVTDTTQACMAMDNLDVGRMRFPDVSTV